MWLLRHMVSQCACRVLSRRRKVAQHDWKSKLFNHIETFVGLVNFKEVGLGNFHFIVLRFELLMF